MNKQTKQNEMDDTIEEFKNRPERHKRNRGHKKTESRKRSNSK